MSQWKWESMGDLTKSDEREAKRNRARKTLKVKEKEK